MLNCFNSSVKSFILGVKIFYPILYSRFWGNYRKYPPLLGRKKALKKLWCFFNDYNLFIQVKPQ